LMFWDRVFLRSFSCEFSAFSFIGFGYGICLMRVDTPDIFGKGLDNIRYNDYIGL
jgi:hypothetical protein